MRRSYIQISKAGFFVLTGLLLTAAIVSIICYLAYLHSKKPPVDQETKETLSKEDIDTSTYQTILDSTTNKVQDFNQEVIKRAQEIENIREE